MPAPYSGVQNVAEFQVSAIPWVTSSSVPAAGTVHVKFPQITQWIIVRNDASSILRVGFTLRGVTVSSNYISLLPSQSFSANVRVGHVYLSGSSGGNYTMVAGLTGIQQQFMNPITGSNGNVGVG